MKGVLIMRKINIELSAEQKTILARNFGTIADELVILVPENNDEKERIVSIDNSFKIQISKRIEN